MYESGDYVDYKQYPVGTRMMMAKSNALSYNDFFEGQRESLLNYFDLQKPVAVIAVVHQMERRLQGPDVICIAIPNKIYNLNANLQYRQYHRWHGTQWLIEALTMEDYDDEELQEDVFGTNYGAQWLPYDIFTPLIGKNQEGKFVLDKLDV